MNDFSVNFTAKAQSDLAEILSYIAEDSLENAISFTDKLFNSINNTLSLQPFAGKFYGTKEDYEVRTFVIHKSYTVFYVVIERQQQVEVIKVFNTYKDNIRFEQKLKQEGIIKSTKRSSSAKH